MTYHRVLFLCQLFNHFNLFTVFLPGSATISHHIQVYKKKRKTKHQPVCDINKNTLLYYKKEIYLADGNSRLGFYSCFSLIISTSRVMDWECFRIQRQHHFLGFFSHIHIQYICTTGRHNCMKSKHINAQSFSNKRRLFYRNKSRGGVLCCLWHELNMPWFQVVLPVVVCEVTAGKYPQQS